MKKWIVLVLLCNASLTHAQKPSYKMVSAFTTPENGYVQLGENEQDRVQYTYKGFVAYLPAAQEANGSIIFMDGAPADTSKPGDAFALVEPAIQKGLAVIFISTGNPVDFLFNDADLANADKQVNNALQQTGLNDQPFILTGLSLSGTRALRYAEYCKKGRSAFHLLPAGIALCDPPLDMVRFWYEEQKAIVRNVHPNAVGEARWVSYLLEYNLGGIPDVARENYIRYSPYVYTDLKKEKLPLFLNIPVRAYHEPDVNWWMDNRGKDYYSMNSIDLAAFINDLRLAGNKKAELITTYNKRKGVTENASPHTWTIVDNDDLAAWAAKVMNK